MVMGLAHQFGNRLRALRAERGLLQRDLEADLNLRPGSVSQYERGLREPGFDLLLAIADLFEVSLDYLLGRPGAPVDSPSLTDGRARLQAALQGAGAAPGTLTRPDRLALVLSLAEQVAPGQFGLTRLALRLSVPPSALRACRDGAGRLPGPAVAELARYLGVALEWLDGA